MAGQSQRDLREVGWQPTDAQAQFCWWTPKEIPAASVVVDSITGLEAARQVPGFEGQAARYVLSVQYDTAGAVTDVYSVDSTLAPEREVELMDAIYANLRTDVEDIRGVRVGMFGGPNPELAVGPIHECRPLLLNRDLVLRMLTRDVEKANLRGAAELWIRVAANGLPLEWRFAKHSGSQGMDAAAYNAVVRMRFLPARIDGVPRAVWVSIPIGTSG